MTIIPNKSSSYFPIDNIDTTFVTTNRLAALQTRRLTDESTFCATTTITATASTKADNWLSSVVENSSFVKAVLPQEYTMNKFQLMEGINSPLPESIQHGSNGLKYRVHSKSNRYNN